MPPLWNNGTYFYLFSMSIFRNTQLQLSTYGQFETMGLLWKPLFRPSGNDVVAEKTSSDSTGTGQTAALEVHIYDTWFMHEAGSARDHLVGFTKVKSVQQRDPGPLPWLFQSSVTFLHTSLDADEGTRGHCSMLLCPLMECWALGVSQSSKTTFSSEN